METARTEASSELILHVLQQRLYGLVARERTKLNAFFHVWLLQWNLSAHQKYKHASYDVSISGIERIVGADLGDFLELFEGFSKTGKVEDLHITKVSEPLSR